MRIISSFLSCLLLAGLISGAAQAQSLDNAYTQIKPALPTGSGDKIEVAEIFWYGCSHCYTFEPHVKSWLKTIPDDVVFRPYRGY